MRIFKKLFKQVTISQLETKIKVQKEKVRLLQIAAKEYRSSYYTDRYHDACLRLIELQSEFEYLESL